MLYIDAMFVTVKDGAHIKKRPFYVVLGIQTDRKRDVLGLWAAQSEGAKFWLEVLTELENRGVQDVFFVCADGLSGIDQAIGAAFQNAIYQTCVVHLIRNAMQFVSWADRKELAAAFRELYTAPNEPAALDALARIEERFGQKYPGALRVRKSRWSDFVPFLAYPVEIRKILYTTNPIESLNSQLRKPLRHRDLSRTTNPSSRSSSSPSKMPKRVGDLRLGGSTSSRISTSSSKVVYPCNVKEHEVLDALHAPPASMASLRTRLCCRPTTVGPMKGSTMVATLQRLGIVPSFSRPRVSDDNAYAEALFKTLKYRPEYPRKPFPTIDAARRWVQDFVHWYNSEHLHSAIRYVTPDDRHVGRDVDPRSSQEQRLPSRQVSNAAPLDSRHSQLESRR